MRFQSVNVALTCVTLAGCTSFYPLPIQEPKAIGSDGLRARPDPQRGGLSPAKTISEAIENSKIYGDAYQEQATKLRGNDYILSDSGFAGGILGVVGGLTKSLETAIAGAVIAGGSSVISQRYQFLVQATNYEKASDAMYCMYGKLYPVDWDEVTIVEFANERIDEIRRKLRKVQSSVQLASPDLGKLEDSIRNVIKSKDTHVIETARLKQRGLDPLAIKKALAKEDLDLLKSELQKCVAAF